jgi:DNA primase catalytic core
LGSYAPETAEDYQYYVDIINRMWKDIVSPVDLEENQILVDGNMLMKNWALSDPNFLEVNADGKSVNGFAGVPNMIIVDEAQDINPVFLGMLLTQDEVHKNNIQRFIVGDPLQQIFGFRGTANAFESIPLDRILPLTQSFRFGSETADVANKILEYVKAGQQLIGNPNVSTSIDEKNLEDLNPDLVIARTNFGIIEAGLFYSILSDGKTVSAATSNFKRRYTESLKYLRWLSAGGINTGRKYNRSTPKEFVGMQTWDTFIAAASARQNADLVAMKNMIFRIKKMQRFEKNWEAIEYLQDLVDNMRIVRETFSVPDEIGKAGKLGGRIKYVIDKGRVVLSDSSDKNRKYGTGVWDNTVVLKLNGFAKGETEDTKFSWSAPAKADVAKQLQELVSMLNGEDADMVLTTAHGAKGLEADRVAIWDDWADPRKSAKERDRAFAREELRLAYVALTRAKEAMFTGGLRWVIDGDMEQMANHRFADEEGANPVVVPATPDGQVTNEQVQATNAERNQQLIDALPNVGGRLATSRLSKADKDALDETINYGGAVIAKKDAITRLGVDKKIETDRILPGPPGGEDTPLPDQHLVVLENGSLVEVPKGVYDKFTPGTGAPTVNRMASEASVDEGYLRRAAAEISYLETSIKLDKEDLQRPEDQRLYREPDSVIEQSIKFNEDKIQEIKDNPLYQKKIDQELVDMAPELEQALRENSATEDQRLELMMRAGITIWPNSVEPVKLFKNLDKLRQRVEEAQLRLNGDIPSVNKMVSSGGDDTDLENPEESVPASGEPVDDTVLSGYRAENQTFAEQMGQQMIDAIQKTGKLPWQKPWSSEGTLPTSGATGKVYRRYNLLWLNMVSEIMGYKGTRWYTENNIKKMGGYLASDATGTAIAYVKTVKKKEKQKVIVADPERPGETVTKTEEVEKSYAKIGWFTVYNEDNIRGIELPPVAQREPVEAVEAQQILMDSYKNHPPILHRRQDDAYWSPVIDEIHLPMLDQFSGPEELFATIAHEFTHSTNHPDRLNNRKDAMENYGKHIESRAREELVAEIGAAMLGQIFNINVTYDNSVNYVNSWLESLKDDPAMVMEAATLAGQAVEYMLGGYWLSIEKGLVDVEADNEYTPTEAIGAATGEITGTDGEFNGLGGGVNYRIEGDQVILLGNTKEYKDEIKSVSVDNNGRPFKFFWHGKSGTWRISLGGENAEDNRKEALKELRDKIAEKSPAAEDADPGVNRMAARVQGEGDEALIERIYQLTQDIADYYHENFMSASAYSPVVKYFMGRGFNRDIAAKFQIGRSTGRTKGAGWKSLINHLAKLGYSEEEMLASGVINKNEDNGLIYDLFAAGPTGDDRLVFPIKNADGQVTGFVARSINPDETAKYMYSKTTAVSRKSNSLFGIDVARDAIKKRNQIIFVEGQMDALALHAAGVDNAVAISGSAFGQGHLNVFESLVAENRTGEYPYPMITFFFDPDKAGQRAQDEAFRLLQNREADDAYVGSILNLPMTKYAEKDPADIYKEFGAEGILDVVKNRKVDASYTLTQAYLARDVDRLVGLIAAIASPSEREELIRLFAESLGMSYNELKQLVDAAIQGRP